MLKRPRKDDEDGVVLVTVLLLSMIMLIIVAGTMAYALGSQPLSRRDQDWNAALVGGRGRPGRLPVPPERERPVLPVLADDPRRRTATRRSPRGCRCRTRAPRASPVPPARTRTSRASATRWTPRTSPSQGAIIITSTGRSRNVTRSVQATLRRHSFIDYLYFTDYETKDPAAYDSSRRLHARPGADVLREALLPGSRHRRAARTSPATRTATCCTEISFSSDDTINGPLHSNDAIRICGDPTFNGKVTTSWNPATGNKWVDTAVAAGRRPTFTRPATRSTRIRSRCRRATWRSRPKPTGRSEAPGACSPARRRSR